MFDRFTDRARKVMGLARQEAQRFNHQYIGTEHVLLGLSMEGNGVAANCLRRLNTGPDSILKAVTDLVHEGPAMVTMGQLPFTPRTKRALELSAGIANDLKHNYIGTEHLLLGLVYEDEGNAAKALKSLGLTSQVLSQEILECLGADHVALNTVTPDNVDYDVLVQDEAPYQEFTRSTAVYPGVNEQGFESAAYCTLGLTGEAGEVAEKLKKRFRLGGAGAFKPGSVVLYTKTGQQETYAEFVESVKKELGDVLWYVAGLSSEFGLSLSDVVKGNLEKLTSRKKRGVLKGSGDNR